MLRSGKHFKEMWAALKNPKTALDIDTAIRTRKGAEFADAAGLELTSADDIGPQEEAIRSALSDKIPGIQASNRAYVTYLNLQRAQAFDSIVESLPHTPTLEEAKALADFVNIATGRASGRGAKIADRLEGIRFFWAPKYLVSRFQVLGRPITMLGDKRLTGAGKRAIAKEYLRYIAGQAAYYAMLGGIAKLLGDQLGEEVEIGTDIRSSDFGKIRVGDTRVDPLSGLAQVGVFLARQTMGETKTLGGKVKKLNQGTSKFDQTRFAVALRFVRSKAGPIPSRVWDALEGEEFGGKKTTPAKALLRLPVPGAIGDIWEAGKRLGIPAAAILGAFAMIGDSVQTYEEKGGK